MEAYTQSDNGKRRRDDEEEDLKRSRMSIERQAEELEWPIYNHPEGGIVKVTPWGILRQYTDANGNAITSFEDKDFSELKMEPPETLYYPLTPQSFCPTHNALPPPQAKQFGQFQLSPSNEVEGYVVDGYQLTTPPQQYEQEHEHYFGMDEGDITM